MLGYRPPNCLSHFPRSQATHNNSLSPWRELIKQAMITQSLNSSVFSLSLVAVARAASHTKIKDDLITFISAFLTSRPGQVMLDHKARSLPAPSKACCPLSLQELITVTYGHDAISLLALWELRVGLSLQNPHYVWLVVISSNALPP